MTIREVAALFGISNKAVCRWTRMGCPVERRNPMTIALPALEAFFTECYLHRRGAGYTNWWRYRETVRGKIRESEG